MMALAPYAALFTILGGALLMLAGALSARVVAAYAVLMVAALAGGVDVMGLAKPLQFEVRKQDEIRPAHIIYHPEVAIYVLTQTLPPRLYQMPWNAEKARRMQQAEQSGNVTLRLDDESGQWVPYAMPQTANPPKRTE